MSLRKSVLFVLVATILLPAAAKADSLQFGFSGGSAVVTTGIGTGTISNNPLMPAVTFLPHISTLSTIGTTNLGTLYSGTLGTAVNVGSMGTVMFTTGTVASLTTNGSGIINSMVFNPGGNITVTSATAIGTIAAGTTLFSGVFSSSQSLTSNSTNGNGTPGLMTLSGLITTNTLNSSLLTLLGLPPLSNGTFTSLEIDISFPNSGGGIKSGTI